MILVPIALALSLTQAPDPAVAGKVRLLGDPPVRESWEVGEEMLPFHDSERFVDEAWLVGEKGELANVVLTFHALDVDEPPPIEPLRDVVYEKVGIRYEPRVLIVTVGTEVTLRNRNSPCNGFSIRGKRNQFNSMISAGEEKPMPFDYRGICPVRCDVREYMRGVIYAVDTPYYAKSDVDGRFALPALPAGRYRLKVWHEGLGIVKVGVPEIVTMVEGEPLRLELELRAPKSERDG